MPDENTVQKPSLSILPLFERFVAERRFLQNVSSKTVEWYKISHKAFVPYLPAECSEDELRLALRNGVMALAAEGKRCSTTVNDYARAMNSFCGWMFKEEIIGKPITLAKLKETKRVIEVLTEEQVQRLLAFTPKKKIERRIHTMIILILDCGMRIDEVLNLQKLDVDLENLLVRVRKGKGDKQRIVPISLPMRRILYRHVQKESHAQSVYVFSTAKGTVQTYRNSTRTLKLIGARCGCPTIRFHLLRHTMATNFLRLGGNIAILRRILGHSSISTTMIYEHLQNEDLKLNHHQHSLVARLR